MNNTCTSYYLATKVHLLNKCYTCTCNFHTALLTVIHLRCIEHLLYVYTGTADATG